MNKKVIIYMLQKTLYKDEMLRLKKVLKEMVLFFVLQIQEIEFLIKKTSKALKYSYLRCLGFKIQFFVLGSGFSVLVPAPNNFNSLYLAPDSLKMTK